MFKPYKRGSQFAIGYDRQEIRVNLPPVGWVFNRFTGKMEKRGVLFKWKKEEHQVWERTPLPEEWDTWREEEDSRREINPTYTHPDAQKFREQEWDRRINGVWIMIQGKPIYLTGLHYFHLNWMEFDFGYPSFREVDLEVFYLLQYCIEDPKCYGLCLATRRRFGKTMILVSFMLEYVTRTANAYAGMQSMTDKDARDIWELHLLYAWKRLPDFFQPVYDESGAQTSEIFFKPTKTKGKRKKKVKNPFIDREALHSRVNYRNSDVRAYDGKKLHRYVMEEPGKTSEANVNTRWEVIAPTMTENDDIIGKAFCPTTIEEAEGNALENFVQLFENSDVNDLDEMGHTTSGMYNHFIPAYRSMAIDKRTGINDEKKAKKKLDAKRKKLQEQDMQAFIRFARKYPYTWQEAKMKGTEHCEFDAATLNQRKTEISRMEEEPFQYGNFEWEGGVIDSKVEWIPCDKSVARWKLSFLPPPSMNNKVRVVSRFRRGQMEFEYYPEGEHYFVAGADPVSKGRKNVLDTQRMSMAAAHIFMKTLPDDVNNATPKGHNFICQYHARRTDPIDYFEDMILMVRFFGCQILIENQKSSLLNHLKYRGYENFIMWRPETTFTSKGQASEGAPSSDMFISLYVERLQTFIRRHGHRIPFPDLIDQLLDFDADKPKKYDLVVSAGFTLIANEGKVEHSRNSGEEDLSINDIFRKKKIRRTVTA